MPFCFSGEVFNNDSRFYCCDGLRSGGCMAHLKFLIAPVVLAFSSSSFAFYATVGAPTGVTSVGGKLLYQASASDLSYANGIKSKISGSLNLGGRSLSVPVAFRYAGTAARVAAAFAFSNPGMLALGAASLAYAYYQEHDYVVIGGAWQKVTDEGGAIYTIALNPPITGTSPGAVCNGMASFYKSNGGYQFEGATGALLGSDPLFSCVVSSIYTSTTRPISKAVHDGKKFRDVTQEEFEETMAPTVIPPGVPQQLPVPLPVEIPVLDPVEVPSPDRNLMQHEKPIVVPQGEPFPVVPATSPPTVKQPIVEVKPAGTPAEPWRVDVTPKDKISVDLDVDGKPDPVTDPANDPTKTEEKTPDLCEKHPEILACAKPELDTPPTPELETQARELTFTPEQGWDSAGSCPAPRHLPGANIDFQFTYFCNFMSGIKPILLTVASLIAGMIIIGARGGGAD